MRNDYAPINVNPVSGVGGGGSAGKGRGFDETIPRAFDRIVRRGLETKPKVQKTGYKIAEVKIAASAIFHLSKVVDG